MVMRFILYSMKVIRLINKTCNKITGFIYYDYSIFFFFNINAIIIDSIAEIIKSIKNASVIVAKLPNGTFIPINDDIIVGIDNTIVAPARNFITLFKLFDTTVA